MSTQISSLLLTGAEGTAREVAQRAARLAFPGVQIVPLEKIEDAWNSSQHPGRKLLVITAADFREAKASLKMLSGSEATPWGVVVLGPEMEDNGIEVVPPEAWEIRNLARVFQAAADKHHLRQENARLRGDLQTIGSRVCHDLRTPLHGMLAAAEALQEAAGSPEVHETLCEALLSSGEELEKLIERVSFLMKASGALRECRRFPMSEAVFAALTRLERRILQQGAAIAESDSWPEVFGVSAWLETIWWNLIANALTHAGGPVRIELGWRQDAAQWFWVRDNGPGVRPERQAGLFQPFHRLHETDAPRGLGLATVQRLVEMQGGACTYEALLEGGTRFAFSLPPPPQ
jgi:signal transduction histidine kinase